MCSSKKQCPCKIFTLWICKNDCTIFHDKQVLSGISCILMACMYLQVWSTSTPGSGRTESQKKGRELQEQTEKFIFQWFNPRFSSFMTRRGFSLLFRGFNHPPPPKHTQTLSGSTTIKPLIFCADSLIPKNFEDFDVLFVQKSPTSAPAQQTARTVTTNW